MSTETLVCECCGSEKYLRRVGRIMTDDPGGAVVCSPCISIWYDLGLTDTDDIGKKSRELRAAGKWPWSPDQIAAYEKQAEFDAARAREIEAKELATYQRLKTKFEPV